MNVDAPTSASSPEHTPSLPEMEPTRPARISAQVRPLMPLLPYQREDVESPARFNWCCWSRQIGKSFTKSLRRLLRGIQRRRTQILLSAGERQSRELMLKVQQHCRALDMVCRSLGDRSFAGANYGSLALELPNGVRIIGLPANPQTVRGFTGDVFLDEFAMHSEDRQIWAAVFPSVLRGDGELDVASTPKGCDNLFAELRHNPHFRHSTVTLADAIAAGLKIDAEEIRRSMNDDELYRQEFCCEFLDEASAFLTYEQIRTVEDPALQKRFDLAGLARCEGELYCGMDIARHRDLTVIWILEKRQQVDKSTKQNDAMGNGSASQDIIITRGVRESQAEPFREQWAFLRALLALRQLRKCCIDAGGIGMALAEAAVEAFGSSRVEPVTFTTAMKDELATRLRMRIEEGSILIPADEAIRGDWHSVRRSVTAAGPARYEAGRSGGSHADRFWAAALAVRAAGLSPGAIEHVRTGPVRFFREGIW